MNSEDRICQILTFMDRILVLAESSMKHFSAILPEQSHRLLDISQNLGEVMCLAQ